MGYGSCVVGYGSWVVRSAFGLLLSPFVSLRAQRSEAKQSDSEGVMTLRVRLLRQSLRSFLAMTVLDRPAVPRNPKPVTRGFTLLELLIAITISIMISAALYLSLRTALESWQTTQDQLVVQQVLSQVMAELTEGLPETYGLRDAMEIVDGSAQHISIVMPWTDDTHDVTTGIFTYILNKHIKPGTSLPIADVLLPESKRSQVVPISLMDQGHSEDYPRLQLRTSVPAGSRLRFTFHPDSRKDADVLTAFRHDPSQQAIFVEDKEGTRSISQNLFGVKITDFVLRYFDNTNTEVGFEGAIDSADILSITGLEVRLKAVSRGGHAAEALSFVSLRNAPLHSGNLTLKEGARIPIPNSKEVKALFLTNLTGIENQDALVLKARPESGKEWVLKVEFAKPVGTTTPTIGLYSIEYPPGNKIYSERLNTPAELGLSLTTLGPNGLYDYDDDDMEDSVILDGKVTLEVAKMDIGGAAIFVRP